MRLLYTLAVFAVLILVPLLARAQERDPLNYPLKQYGFMLATALLGGLVSWYAKLRDGKVKAWSLQQFIGELSTSAFAGLLAFWVCEWANTPAALTPALVGIAGHMGTRAITALEDFAQRRFAAKFPTIVPPPADPSAAKQE